MSTLALGNTPFSRDSIDPDVIRWRNSVLQDGGEIVALNEVDRIVKKLRRLGLYTADATIFATPARKTGKLYTMRCLSPNDRTADIPFARSSAKTEINASGNVVPVTTNLPAFDFNLDESYRGMSHEPLGINQIRNNAMDGAIVGNPGTLPTYHSINLDGGLISQVIDLNVVNGIKTINLRFSGTATGTIMVYRFEGTTQIVASVGQSWAESLFAQVIEQPNPPNAYQIHVIDRTAAGEQLNSTITPFTPTVNLRRYQAPHVTGALTERVQPHLSVALTIGQYYDFTIRIGLPQMETGSVATSPIETSGSTVNRTADGSVLAGIGSIIGQSQGGVFMELEWRNDGVSRRAWTLDDNQTQNFRLSKISSGALLFASTISVGNNGSITSPGSFSGKVKTAMGYALNDMAAYANAQSLGIDNTIDIPPTSRISIGSAVAADHINGWILPVVLFRIRPSNANLLALATS